jgi:hypothetical protein
MNWATTRMAVRLLRSARNDISEGHLVSFPDQVGDKAGRNDMERGDPMGRPYGM